MLAVTQKLPKCPECRSLLDPNLRNLPGTSRLLLFEGIEYSCIIFSPRTFRFVYLTTVAIILDSTVMLNEK